MGSRDKRVAYIASLIMSYDKQVSKKKVEDESKQKNRLLGYKYHLRTDGKC